MKTLTILLSILFAAFSLTAMADTIEGKACCPKCCLKTADTCGLSISVEKDGKKETLEVEPNDVSKAFHKEICKAPSKVKAEGRKTWMTALCHDGTF